MCDTLDCCCSEYVRCRLICRPNWPGSSSLPPPIPAPWPVTTCHFIISFEKTIAQRQWCSVALSPIEIHDFVTSRAPLHCQGESIGLNQTQPETLLDWAHNILSPVAWCCRNAEERCSHCFFQNSSFMKVTWIFFETIHFAYLMR